MKKYIRIFLCLIILCLFTPITSMALSSSYKDVLADELDVKVDKNKINIYLFYGDGCPHCASEKELLKKITEKYKGKVNIYLYEVWDSKDNSKLMHKFKEKFGLEENTLHLSR